MKRAKLSTGITGFDFLAIGEPAERPGHPVLEVFIGVIEVDPRQGAGTECLDWRSGLSMSTACRGCW